MTVGDLLIDDLIDALGDCRTGRLDQTQRRFGGCAGAYSRQDEIPGATMFESLWVWSDTPAGRVVMVDGRKTLVSALVNGADASPSDPRAETAIWGEGETNSLVAVLKAIVTGRLDTADPDP